MSEYQMYRDIHLSMLRQQVLERSMKVICAGAPKI